MNIGKRQIALAVFIFISLGCASEVHIHNSRSDFETYLSESQTDSKNAFPKAWEKFESHYSEVYLAVFPQDDPAAQSRKASQLETFRLALPALRPGILSFFSTAEAIINQQLMRFSQTFPDLRSGTSIFVVPSLLTFNGKVVTLPSTGSTFLLGVDKIVQRGDDLDILFSHEFFHIYHGQKLAQKKTWLTFATPLWLEGIATYVSGQLNPQKTDAELLMDAALAKTCSSKAFIAKRAREYLAIIDKTEHDPQRDQIYTDWFLLNGSTTPVRSGYCLGLAVVRLLARKHELKDMVNWGEDTFAPYVKESLENLSQSTR